MGGPGKKSDTARASAVQLSSVHHGCIGFFVGSIEQSIMRPSVYWKAMLQQQKFKLAEAVNPRFCYRGLPVAVASIAPITFIQFGANSGFNHGIQVARGRSKLSESEKLASGVFAGVVSAVVQSPCQLVEINQQNLGGSMSSVARRVISEHGVFGLFRGLSMTMIREGVFCASYIAGQPILCDALRERRPDLSQSTAVMASSAVSGVVGAIISHPADTFKTQLQGGIFSTGPQKVHTMREVARRLEMSGSLSSAAFRGFTPRCFRLVCCVYIYSSLTSAFEGHVRNWLATPSRIVVEAGAASGVYAFA